MEFRHKQFQCKTEYPEFVSSAIGRVPVLELDFALRLRHHFLEGWKDGRLEGWKLILCFDPD